MMGLAGITVALAVCSFTGVVGAASLPPDDQYSPQQSPYRRDGAQESRGYPNWLKYEQDLTTRLEPPDYKADMGRLDSGDFSKESLDLLPQDPGGWNIAADSARNLSVPTSLNLDVPEDTEIAAASSEDGFSVDDTFQDQGPGSVEVYKLDLRRENSLLVPHESVKKSVAESRLKSKIPKKATAEEILWKLKTIENRKEPLPAIFRQLPHNHRNPTLSRESNQKVMEKRRDEIFGIGGVPELQVGCEGVEAYDRQKRSSEADAKATGVEDGDDDWNNYQDPIYRESTDPILLRVTPIVLDLDDEEPPSGEIYEELDALLKLQKDESTSPRPTTRRWNRADIDPAFEVDKHRGERTTVETFPERGDLGPNANGSSKEESIDKENYAKNRFDKRRFRRDSDTLESSRLHRGGRKLLWHQYPEREEYGNKKSRYVRETNDQQDDPDIWGFGEDDGALSDTEDEVDRLREVEAEKRRREYERRKQEELERRRGKTRYDDQRNFESHHPNNENSEIERIREQYERQLDKEGSDRRRMEEDRRRQDTRRREGEDYQRRIAEDSRRQEEESRRRAEEEERMRNRDPTNSRRGEEEEERRREWNRRRFENQRNRQEPPSALTRPETPRADNTSIGQPEDQYREQKLREYIERNRPKKIENRRLDEESRREENAERVRNMEEQRRRQMEEDRGREQLEESRRRQHQPDENERRRQMEEERRRQHQNEHERRRQMEEQRRRQHQDEAERRRQMEEERRSQNNPDENERRRQMEEQRRPNESREYERRRELEEQRRRGNSESREIEEARRRRLEEERKLQEYVRRNQPVIVPRGNNAQASNTSREKDLLEQRRTLEAARQWERNRQPIVRTNQGDRRIHGPSAPTSIGQRQSYDELEAMRRRQERLEEEERLRESNKRMMEQEERRREEEYRRAESRRREEERRRLEAATRKDEENRRNQSEGRRNTWPKSGSSGHQTTSSRRNDPAGEIRDREAEELRRIKATEDDRRMRNGEDAWRRRSEERQRLQNQLRERQRLENERNSRNNGRRRPQYEDRGPKTGQRGESVRGSHGEMEWRRREDARLRALPVSAKIIIGRGGVSQNGGRPSSGATLTTPPDPSEPSFDARGNFDNGVDYPGLNPNRPGFQIRRFPAPATSRPPPESPGACVWAIVQCCPASNRLVSCFESMGCPGVNWDPNPCRGSLADAARAEVVRFYAAADDANTDY